MAGSTDITAGKGCADLLTAFSGFRAHWRIWGPGYHRGSQAHPDSARFQGSEPASPPRVWRLGSRYSPWPGSSSHSYHGCSFIQEKPQLFGGNAERPGEWSCLWVVGKSLEEESKLREGPLVIVGQSCVEESD